jgi:hypothetical protein
MSLPDGKRTLLARPPGEVVSVSDFSPDGSRVLLNVTGAARPPSAWQYEFDAQRYRQIAPVSTPGVDLEALVSPSFRHTRRRTGSN